MITPDSSSDTILQQVMRAKISRQFVGLISETGAHTPVTKEQYKHDYRRPVKETPF